jgi:hypothetical protein
MSFGGHVLCRQETTCFEPMLDTLLANRSLGLSNKYVVGCRVCAATHAVY